MLHRFGPGLIAAIVEHGGHLSFAESFIAYKCSWIDRVSVEWFNLLINRSTDCADRKVSSSVTKFGHGRFQTREEKERFSAKLSNQ
jgi:hypothetical protein